jgi:hypothetical protein
LESEEIGLCILCNINEGYYPIFNDNSNINNFINCYNEAPDGYYLDENVYKILLLENNNSTGIEEIHNNSTEIINDLTETEEIIYNNFTEIFSDYTSILKNNIENIYDIINNSLYYYELNIDIIELKEIFKNYNFIEITPEVKKFLINKYNLNEEKDKLYLIINEIPNYDSKLVTSNYDYKIVLENRTELNLSNINEDIYINIFSPIKDFNLSHFNYYLYFKKQGYDIYDKYSNFYNDVCSPAYLYDNDIIIEDRQ